jgi:hypothetical protein
MQFPRLGRRSFVLLGAIAAAFAGARSAQAAVMLQNNVGLGADAPLGSDTGFSDTGAFGASSTSMEVRANDTATSRNRLGILRFDLSEISGDMSGASVTLYETGNNSRTVTVYGLLDGDAGENWDESTISYSTAPAISAITGTSTAPATAFDPARTVLLGTFGTTGSTTENLIFSSAELDSFLAADTNDLVTLYFYRDGGGSVTLRTKEFNYTGTIGAPPTLTLPNAEVPEPAALSLLGFATVALSARRRRARV